MVVLSACVPNRFVSGWVPYWNASEGRAGFTNPANTAMFNDISPFFYTALPDGTIGLVGSQSQLTATVTAAQAHGLTVLPSITDGSGKWMMATVILANNTSRAQHIQNIVNLVMTNGFDGIDLDYEGFAFSDGTASWPSARDPCGSSSSPNSLPSFTPTASCCPSPSLRRGWKPASFAATPCTPPLRSARSSTASS